MSETSSKMRSLSELGFCVMGPSLWVVHLVVLYGGHTLICSGLGESRADDTWPSLVATVTVCALLGLAVLVVLQLRHAGLSRFNDVGGRSNFLRRVGLALSGLSALGIVWGTLPATMVSHCH